MVNSLPSWIRQWYRLDRPIGGVSYILTGLIAFAVKFNCDKFLAKSFFGRSWQLFDYVRGANAFYLWDLQKQDGYFFVAMITLAIPFMIFGVIMTMRRLNTLRYSSWMVIFFFVPFVNLPYFALLALETRDAKPRAPAHLSNCRSPWIPATFVGSCLAAAAIAAVFGAAMVGFEVLALKRYGWSLFIFIPFVQGMVASWLYNYHQPRSLLSVQLLSVFSCTITGFLLLSLAIEGAACVIMAAPIWLTMAGMGGWVGWEIQNERWKYLKGNVIVLLCVSAMPLLMGAEYALKPKAPLLSVCTAIRIQATPARVWDHVVTFSELPPPTEWIFRTGLAYPMRAKIQGSGPGAIRRCEFSTGAFIEPIEVWDKPSLLRFAVTDNPLPMRETSFYSHIDPPHLHGYLVSRRGQFKLIEQPDGGTYLEGTTWYEHNLWPATYWKWWSDFIIHQIHLRVLKHIKTLAEQDAVIGADHG